MKSEKTGWWHEFRKQRTHIKRYYFVMFLMLFAAIDISYAMICTATRDRNYWKAVGKRFVQQGIPIPSSRGSILASDGTLLSGTLPEYRVYLDYKIVGTNPGRQEKIEKFRDSIWNNPLTMDTLYKGLARIFPDHTEEWFRKRLEEGKAKAEKTTAERLAQGKKPTSCPWQFYPEVVSYIQYVQCKELPLFREGEHKGGFHGDRLIRRVRPYGDLASRTVGALFANTDTAKNGLEQSFDSVLRGKPGISHRVRLWGRNVKFVDLPPVDGRDIQTTIDVRMQDFADRALRNKLADSTINGELGVAIVMEVATGDVKAIVNLKRGHDGKYYEMKNHAVSDLMEPGSTFKTASMMIAMDDGYIDKDYQVDCNGGIYEFHGAKMKDHNWLRGGYGTLTVSQILEQSSNIGVSRIIERFYHDHPDDYINGLTRIGIGLPLDLPFVGKGEPYIPSTHSTRRPWSKTDLPWMSIGYNTMLPPISTLTFYNAIANGGRMVRPRFVKAELQDGRVVKEYPVDVIKERICKPKTLMQIQECLENVVSIGLGKKAGNYGKYFPVSGKTGTAQFAENGSYQGHKYMVSFCGYFPSDAPKYSCIVCIVKHGTPASGGGQCGPVFREISEYIMANAYTRDVPIIRDSTYVGKPAPKPGIKRDRASDQVMPNVIGMGAKDAVYVLRKRGLSVNVHGVGKVVEQSIPKGSTVKPGKKVDIKLKV